KINKITVFFINHTRFKTACMQLKGSSFLDTFKKRTAYIGNHIAIIVHINYRAYNLRLFFIHVRLDMGNGFYFCYGFSYHIQRPAAGNMAGCLNKHIQYRKTGLYPVVDIYLYYFRRLNLTAYHTHYTVI